jgi:uncharacterized protein
MEYHAAGRRADEIVPRNDTEAAVLGYHTTLMAGNLDGFAGLWAEDAVHESPYHPGKAFRGREIAADYRHMFANRRDMVFTIRELYQTVDPDCVVVEFNGRSTIGETGSSYVNDYVGVFRIRSGRIAHLRLYANPKAAEAAIGSLLDSAPQSGEATTAGHS